MQRYSSNGLNYAYNLSEAEIRYAMENTKSVAQAAMFLKVSYETFRKYAKMYVDSATGKTLFDLHKNQAGTGIRHKPHKPHGPRNPKFLPKRTRDILAGKYPEFNRKSLKNRVIKGMFLEEKCASCGFSERRVTDYKIPLLLEWIDGDYTNHRLENLRLLCYNCYYLQVGDIIGAKI
jgi:hypothetical protein